jgi:two-component system, OmpR family, sensor histidine kinase PrrB
LQTAVPTSATDELVENLRYRAVEVALLSAVLAGAAGWFFGEVAMRPLARLRSTAERVSTSRDLSVRVPSASGPREVDDLAHSLNIMLQRLQEAADSTESALASSRAFAGNAAHEMRTPLTSMQANLDILARNPNLPADQMAEIVQAVVQEQTRLVRLLDALHTLARGDVVGDAQREPMDLADVVGVAVDTIGRRFPDVTYNYEVPHVLTEISGWPDGLRLMAENLLTNAARHGGHTVNVTVDREGEYMRLIVDDDGPGVPESERTSIFDRFYRGEGTIVPGSGLGLALVAQQARLHGGDVVVESSPQGGARFVVSLKAEGRSEPAVSGTSA